MVSWQKISFGGLEISARPSGRFRRDLPLPYFKGEKPRFKLVLKRLPKPEQISSLTWFIRFSNRDQTGHKIEISELVPGQVHETEIGDKLLGFTGDTILGIAMGEGVYHTLCSFEVVSKWDLISRGLITTVAALLAAILTALLV